MSLYILRCSSLCELQFNILQSYKGNYIALTILKLNFAMPWLWAKKLNFMVCYEYLFRDCRKGQ